MTVTHRLCDSGAGQGKDVLEATLRSQNTSDRPQRVEVEFATAARPSPRVEPFFWTIVSLRAAGADWGSRCRVDSLGCPPGIETDKPERSQGPRVAEVLRLVFRRLGEGVLTSSSRRTTVEAVAWGGPPATNDVSRILGGPDESGRRAALSDKLLDVRASRTASSQTANLSPTALDEQRQCLDERPAKGRRTSAVLFGPLAGVRGAAFVSALRFFALPRSFRPCRRRPFRHSMKSRTRGMPMGGRNLRKTSTGKPVTLHRAGISPDLRGGREKGRAGPLVREFISVARSARRSSDDPPGKPQPNSRGIAMFARCRVALKEAVELFTKFGR